MKAILTISCVSLALVMGAIQATAQTQTTNSLFSITNVVRPGGATTANTILVGTSSVVPTTMSVSSSNVTLSAKNGYFVSYFSSQTLGVGDTISFTYNGTFTNADSSGNGFRVGMFNSAAGPIYTNDQGSVNTQFTNYTGYITTARETLTNKDGVAVQRGTATSLFGTSPSVETFSTTVAGLGIGNGTNYTGYFSITRTSNLSLYVEYKFGNQAVQSFSDTNGIVSSFNSFGIYLNNTISNTPTSITMTEMNILYTTAIPEPGSLKLLLLGFMFGGVVFFWRKKSMRNTAS